MCLTVSENSSSSSAPREDRSATSASMARSWAREAAASDAGPLPAAAPPVWVSGKAAPAPLLLATSASTTGTATGEVARGGGGDGARPADRGRAARPGRDEEELAAAETDRRTLLLRPRACMVMLGFSLSLRGRGVMLQGRALGRAPGKQ